MVRSEREVCEDAEVLGLGFGREEDLERDEGGSGRDERVEVGREGGEGMDQSSAVPPSAFELSRDVLFEIEGEDDELGRGREDDGIEEKASWEEPPDVE